MKDLELIEEALEKEVKNYLLGYSGENESLFEDIDIDVTVNGVDYSATVSVDAYFTFEEVYETDKYGTPYHIGDDCNLDTFDFQIKDLWDYELGEYIIEEYEEK